MAGGVEDWSPTKPCNRQGSVGAWLASYLIFIRTSYSATGEGVACMNYARLVVDKQIPGSGTDRVMDRRLTPLQYLSTGVEA